MKSKLLILLLTIVVLFSGCQKTESDLTVTLKMSGKLAIHLATSDGTVIPNQKIKLYTGYYSSGSLSSEISYTGLLNTVKTNENGDADFSELNTGSYFIVAQDVKIGNANYNIVKPIQVISGSTNIIHIDPTEFVGKLTLSVYSYMSFAYNLVSNVNVVLVESTKASDTLTHEEVMALAVVKGKTDAKGKVIFDQVPSNRNFAIYVYYDDNKRSWSYSSSSTSLNTVFVGKEEERTSDVYVDYNKLNNILGNLKLNLTYYGYKNGNYNQYDISNANVILVKYSDYSNYNLYSQNLAYISQFAVQTSTTDASGNVTFSDLALNSSYYLFIYYTSTLTTWCNYSLNCNYPLATSFTSIDISNYSNLGL